ncbi:RNA-directed DNA polymerase, eukaryota, Reverse transcriptase zinc-binding domain protein [Artemisia annua]|uniref:RNA-directed DNA polymerase, eukaryota, Reverse transcriptase zinc-binding domain protein n=1 Tax=Artemisia annua TaxID=35608 RepID=A0A2U1L3L2_ARTAN|nr:RNA-directed DNA polymerase, eukaryota, Reverse transcriptase zinc-binding domain protein [Artemisia annua]
MFDVPKNDESDEVDNIFDETAQYMESKNVTDPLGQALPLLMVPMYNITSWNIKGMNQSHKQNENLATHKVFVRGKPWYLMGNFNAALNLEYKAIGLHFRWNQKPKGDHGVLKKIDRVLENLDFYDLFVGASALFQPYRISKHSPAILRIPKILKF